MPEDTALRKKGILLCPLPLQDAVLQLMDKCKFVPVASCFLDPYLVDRPKAVPPSALWNRAYSTGPEESPQATSRGTSGRARQVSHPTSQPTPGLVVAGIARIADLPALAKNLTSSSQPYLAQEGFSPGGDSKSHPSSFLRCCRSHDDEQKHTDQSWIELYQYWHTQSLLFRFSHHFRFTAPLTSYNGSQFRRKVTSCQAKITACLLSPHALTPSTAHPLASLHRLIGERPFRALLFGRLPEDANTCGCCD